MKSIRQVSDVCIIIPAYNEASTIGTVIARIRTVGPRFPILVIDDGSTDMTATIAAQHGATVLSHAGNGGIGAAVQTGLSYAVRHGYTAALQIDADGQHNPDDIPALLAHRHDADLIIGNRYGKPAAYRYLPHRRWGARISTWVLARLWGIRIADPTSGFRLFTGNALPLLARHYPLHLPEPESLALALSRQLTVREVPVTMFARQGGTSSVTIPRAAFLCFAIPFGIVWVACTGRLFVWPWERLPPVAREQEPR